MLLTEVQSKQWLQEAGVPVIQTRLAHNQTEAIKIAREIGFPVVLKIVSPDISHKSDAGGVRLGLNNANQIRTAYREIVESCMQYCPKASIHGVSVQKMARKGVETIIGVARDQKFGHVLMFGLGGIQVEILKDVAVRLIPLQHKDASEIIRDIKGFPLLTGFRSQLPVSIPSLEEMILKISDFVYKNPSIVEMDLNPVVAHENGTIVVDARIVLEGHN